MFDMTTRGGTSGVESSRSVGRCGAAQRVAIELERSGQNLSLDGGRDRSCAGDRQPVIYDDTSARRGEAIRLLKRGNATIRLSGAADSSTRAITRQRTGQEARQAQAHGAHSHTLRALHPAWRDDRTSARQQDRATQNDCAREKSRQLSNQDESKPRNTVAS
jgi:hypothetical protein